MAKGITLGEVKARLKGLDEDTQKNVVCALVGHSRINTTFFGYYYCARCSEQVGDTLASSYPAAEKAVIVDHNCAKCRENAKTLRWRDTFLSPDPFAKPNPAPSQEEGG